MSPLPRRTKWLRLFSLSLLFSTLNLGAWAADAKKPVDLPAGVASETLKNFARQTGREIVFAPDTVGSVQTNVVKGEFSPKEALKIMLADTGLIATQDAKTGAFAVRKGSSVANAPRALQKSGSRPDEAKKTEEVLQLEKLEVTGSQTGTGKIR